MKEKIMVGLIAILVVSCLCSVVAQQYATPHIQVLSDLFVVLALILAFFFGIIDLVIKKDPKK